jgi:tetratricopeptide (TPR) repeat protein
MAALLAELRRDPARHRRSVLLAAAAVTAVAAAIVVPRLLAADAIDPCDGGAAQIANAWSAPRADRVRAAFAAIDRAWATHGGARAIAALDDHARRWAVSYRRVCEASDRWSELVRGRGTRCLGRARASIAAVAAVMSSADAAVAAHADQALADLADPDACADFVKMSRYADPPADPARARAGAAIEAAVERARALGDAGRPGITLAILPSLAILAASVDDPSTRGGALVTIGHDLDERRDTARAIAFLREAYFIGRDRDDDELTALASRELAAAFLFAGQLDVADDWSHIALADARHTGRARDQVEVLDGLASVALRREALPGALDYADRAVALARTVATPTVLAEALATRAPIHGEAGDHRAEIADYRAALDLMAHVFGDDHPSTLELRSQLGYALGEIGSFDEAIVLENRTIEIAMANPSPDTRAALADATAALGGILLDAGRYDEAAAVLDRAVALLAGIEGRNDDVASVLNNRGTALVELGRTDEATAILREALSIVTAPETADPFMVATIEDELAAALLARHDLDGAEAQARASIAGWEQLGVDPVRAALARGALADVLAARRDPRADEIYAKAVAQIAAAQAAPDTLGRIELRWARFVAARGDRARAARIARSARDHLGTDAAQAAEADVFLHGLTIR